MQTVTLAMCSRSNAIPMSINNAVKDKTRFDRAILENDYKEDPLTFNIINKNLQLMMHAGFEIKAKTDRWQKFYDDFFENIGDVGEEVTDKELVEYILQDLLMYGNAYVELIYEGDINKKVLDLRVIPEKYMDYAKNGSKEIGLDKYGKPIGYIMHLPSGQSAGNLGDEIPKIYKNKITKGGDEIFFLPQRIAHFKLFTYGDRYYGIGLIEVAHTSVERKMKIEDARTNEIYTRGANTIIANVGDETHEPGPNDLKQVLDNISNFRYDRYFSFPKWVDIKTLPIDENSATDRTLDYLRINQSACSGMPMAIITGQGETANKQTLDTQQFILELSLENIVKKFSSTFKKYILRPIAKSNSVKEIADIVFGDIVAEDKTSKSNRLTAAVAGKILAPEEVRPYILGAEGLEPDEKAYKEYKSSQDKQVVQDKKQPIKEELSQQVVKLGGFYMPEITKETNLDNLNDKQILDYHDNLHVLWEKRTQGFQIGWTFYDISLLHQKAIDKLVSKNLRHITPINDLDKIDWRY
jgi:hypothetical protein